MSRTTVVLASLLSHPPLPDHMSGGAEIRP
jgi:hypothetical protein